MHRMCVKPVALLSASLLLVVVLLATQAAAAAPLPRKLLRLQGAADPEQQIAAMAQFRKAETALLKKVSSGDAGARDTYVALLRGIIGCSGPQPDAELADGSAMALASTSPQYLEYGPFQDLRNSMIQEALASVQASPPKPKECVDSFAVSRQLGIPDAALAVYG